MKRFLTIALAILLLMSNMGFTVATHFCGGQAVMSGLRLGGGDWDCGMVHEASDHREDDRNCTRLAEEACCKNQHQTIQTDNTLSTDFPAPQFHASAVGIAVFPLPYFERFTVLEAEPFRIDPPPLPERDVQVLFQTFLI
ncbi:HYC_CC_PP family protein [Persicitalea jodogahamensis]|uniref:HYC_CC_PP family protein n=1 Tax=Persicitalea jodogahamensis TaxID=402147 RepID=UPI001673076B|nr:hypothetical protein [Persicitalea jodogahamensis]